MASNTSTGEPTLAVNARPTVDYEVIIIGAGFGGVRMIYDLQKRGITARVFEAGSNVGGTWYWNRYVCYIPENHPATPPFAAMADSLMTFHIAWC